MLFLTLFQFLTRLLTTKHLKLLTSWGEMEQCEKRAFQLHKLRKKNQLKHKNQCVTDFFIDRYVFEYQGLHLSLRGEHIKDKLLHYFQ